MQLCLSLSKLYLPAPFEPYLPIVKSLGVNAVEFPLDPKSDLAATKAALQENQLVLGSQFLAAEAWRAEAEEFRRWLEGAGHQLVKSAAEMGCRRFAVWVAPGSDRVNYRDNFDWHANRLRALAGLANEFDATLSLEYIAPKTAREAFKYSFIWNLQQALELCEASGENVGVLLDSWHWHASLGTLRDIRNLSIGRINLVHVNDAPSGVPLEQLVDNERRLPASTGVIDIGGFFESLRSIGYNGLIIPEPFDAGLRDLTPRAALEQTLEATHRALETQPHAPLPPTMQVLSFGRNRAHVTSTPTPRPYGNQVIVRLHSSMICGSNMKQFFGDEEKLNGGHEGAGEVVAVAHSTHVKVGDRVALAPINACGSCRHCLVGDVILCDNRPPFAGNFAEYSRVADTMCIPLPDDIDYDRGSLLGCGLGPAYGALRAMGVRAFSRVLIAGLGPVGLGATALATFLGAEVAAFDPEPYRRDIATQLGASLVLDPGHEDYQVRIQQFFGAAGVLRAIDCTGRGEVQRQLLDLAGKGAHITFIGENQETIPVSPSRDFLRKALIVQGIWHMNLNHVEDLIAFLRRAPEKAELLISHRFKMSECQQAFETFAARQAVKVAICPAQELRL